MEKETNFGLFDYSCYQARSHRSPSFSNIESLSVLDRNGIINIAEHLHVITRHHHFVLPISGALWPVKNGGFIYKNRSAGVFTKTDAFFQKKKKTRGRVGGLNLPAVRR